MKWLHWAIFNVFCCGAARAGNRKFAPTPAASAPVPVNWANSRRVNPRLRFLDMRHLLREMPSGGRRRRAPPPPWPKLEVQGLQLNREVVEILGPGRDRLVLRNDALVERGELQVQARNVPIEAAADALLVSGRLRVVGLVELLVNEEGLDLADVEIPADIGEDVVLLEERRILRPAVEVVVVE